jgi:hypothetical protein
MSNGRKPQTAHARLKLPEATAKEAGLRWKILLPYLPLMLSGKTVWKENGHSMKGNLGQLAASGAPVSESGLLCA